MIVKLLSEHHLEFLSLKGGCRGSSESTYFKMPYCGKSHATARLQGKWMNHFYTVKEGASTSPIIVLFSNSFIIYY